jgi:type 1 fimbria pilin
MSRLVIAIAAGAMVLASAEAATAASTSYVHGTVSGHYRPVTATPDTGADYQVAAHGRTSLGATKAKGHVRGPGNIQQGRCTGRLTLTTSDGTLTVRLRSVKTFDAFASCQSGFAFAWRSVDGTGTYAGRDVSGQGTLTLVKPGNASEDPPPCYVTFDR